MTPAFNNENALIQYPTAIDDMDDKSIAPAVDAQKQGVITATDYAVLQETNTRLK